MKKLLLVILSLGMFLSVCSQRLIEVNATVSPQHLFFVHAVKIDLEIGVSANFNSTLILSPILQIGPVNQFGGASTNPSDQDDDQGGLLGGKEGPDNLVGYGFGLGQRFYMDYGVEPGSKHGFYLSYEISYLKSKITYATVVTSQESVGVVFYTDKKEVQGIDRFRRMSFETVIGDKLLLGKFIIDGYFGVGYTSTKTVASIPGARNYNRNIYDYGFSGVHPVVGVKVGFKII